MDMNSTKKGIFDDNMTIQEIEAILLNEFNCRISITEYMETIDPFSFQGRVRYAFNILVAGIQFVVSGNSLQEVIEEIKKIPYVMELKNKQNFETNIKSITNSVGQVCPTYILY